VFRAIVIVLLAFFSFTLAMPMLLVGLNESEPTSQACDALDPSMSTRWRELKGCHLNWREAGFARVGSTVTEVYVPLYASAEASSQRAGIILASRRHDFLAFGEALLAAPKGGEDLERVLEKHQDLVHFDDPLSGMLRSYSELLDSEKEVLAALPGARDEELLILDDGATPDLLSAIGLFLLGSLFFVGAAIDLRSRRSRRMS